MQCVCVSLIPTQLVMSCYGERFNLFVRLLILSTLNNRITACIDLTMPSVGVLFFGFVWQ